MKKNLKYSLLFIIILTLSSLIGCGQININAAITEDNEVTYSYKMVFNIEEDDINYSGVTTYLLKIKNHWEESGFKANIKTEEESITLIGKISEEYETRQEAFAALYSYMTNDISPFVDVEYEYNMNYYYEDYILKANINLEGLADEDIYTAYPSIVGEDVDDFLENMKCTITINLPQNNSKESDDIVENIVIVDVPFNEQAEVSLSGIINNNANARYEQELNAKKEKEQKNLIIVSCITITCIIGLIILLITASKAKQKPSVDLPDNQT